MIATKVRWLLETDMFLEGNPQRMHEIISSLGMEVKWIKYVPFGGTTLGMYPERDCVVVYGSMNLAREVHKQARWIPGVWADPAALRCSTYYAPWRDFILQQQHAMFTLGEVKTHLAEIVAEYGVEGEIFLRPDENDKSFSGIVVHIDKFDRWHNQNTACYDLLPEMRVVVARPQKIVSEHRFIIADRRVIAGSKYKTGSFSRDGLDAIGFDDAARNYAQHVIDASGFQPHRIFALDVAETPDGYRLMEIGSANSCGLYGCDLRAVIEHASRIAADEWRAEKVSYC